MSPQRIQLSRKKGYRKPADAVNVARPTKWGNPFKVGDLIYHGSDLWRFVPPEARRSHLGQVAAVCPVHVEAAVVYFRHYLQLKVGSSGFTLEREAEVELRGRDLACWCP